MDLPQGLRRVPCRRFWSMWGRTNGSCLQGYPPPGGIALERRGGASLALIWVAAGRWCLVPYGNSSSSKENGTSTGLQFREQIPEWQAGVLLTKEAVWLVHVSEAIPVMTAPE